MPAGGHPPIAEPISLGLVSHPAEYYRTVTDSMALAALTHRRFSAIAKRRFGGMLLPISKTLTLGPLRICIP